MTFNPTLITSAREAQLLLKVLLTPWEYTSRYVVADGGSHGAVVGRFGSGPVLAFSDL